MTRKFIKLRHLCVSILFVCSLARPLSLRDAPSQDTSDLQKTTNQQTNTVDKVLLSGLISAAGIAGVALIALAFSLRKIRKLTKEVMKNNQRDIERQNIAPLCVSPPCETLSSCSQTCNLCKEIGTQAAPIMCEVATQKTARVIAPTEGTFAESIGSVTRVLMESWNNTALQDTTFTKPAVSPPKTRTSYDTNREIIQYRARVLEHELMLANRRRFSPPSFSILEERAAKIRDEIDNQRTIQFKENLDKIGCPEETLLMMKAESWFEFNLNDNVIQHVTSLGYMTNDNESVSLSFDSEYDYE